MIHSDPHHQAYDPAIGPHLVEYQVTRWCEHICSYCPALGGRVDLREDELSTAAAERLLVQVSRFAQPTNLLLTGGDLMYRHDVFRLVQFAHELGISTGAKLCPTTRLTPTGLGKLQNVGLDYLVMSVEGHDNVSHDGIRGGGSVSGEFARTMRALSWARRMALPVQAHTLLVVRNARELDAIASLLVDCGVAAWQIHFLSSHHRRLRHHRVAPSSYPPLFDNIHELSQRHDLQVEIVGANHYVAHAASQGWSLGRGTSRSTAIPRRPIGLHAGKGLMYIDPVGVVYPSREVHVACGQSNADWLVDLYQRHYVFRELRDPNRYQGKCGYCEYREMCGGNRARAMSEEGSMLAEEPDCTYRPGTPELSRMAAKAKGN